MKGFVATPRETVDMMVELLFHKRTPVPKNKVLDPGCGKGEFIDGVIRWCKSRRIEIPRITGVESDARHLPELHTKYEQFRTIHIEHTDFLADGCREYDFIVGNPPYVAITELSEYEKTQYRAHYTTARGRFDLYLLFFEQALRSLATDGRLVFITPEKYLYVESAGPLREMLSSYHLEQILFMSEDTFGDLVTYPTITVVNNMPPGRTEVVRRDGSSLQLYLPSGRDSWLPSLEGAVTQPDTAVLGDFCLRISCGVATGADRVFVQPEANLTPGLRRFAHPTISGRQLSQMTTNIPELSVMLIPYDLDSRLLPLSRLGALRNYLMREEIRERLLARTCVKRKPWYAFHETPALSEILCPKILCKDICETPYFWIDRSGQIVPRHSVYYIVPQNPRAIDTIVDYLQSSDAHKWLTQNCQRASKGYLRLQSHVLRRLPLPDDIAQAAVDGCSYADVDSPRARMDFAFMG